LDAAGLVTIIWFMHCNYCIVQVYRVTFCVHPVHDILVIVTDRPVVENKISATYKRQQILWNTPGKWNVTRKQTF